MKNINDINKIVSKQLKLPLKTIENVNYYLWKQIKEDLSKPSISMLRIKYLGTFYIKPSKLIKKIYSVLAILKVLRKKELKGEDVLEKQYNSKELFKTYYYYKNMWGWRLIKKYTKFNAHNELSFYEKEK